METLWARGGGAGGSARRCCAVFFHIFSEDFHEGEAFVAGRRGQKAKAA